MDGGKQPPALTRVFLMAQQIHGGGTESWDCSSWITAAGKVKSSPCTLSLWNVEEPNHP